MRVGCGILAGTDNVGLIQVAYNRYASGQLTSEKMLPIEGGPDWIHSERFEISAKAEGQPTIPMMQGPMTTKFEIHLKFSPDDSAAPVTAEPGAAAAVRSLDTPGIFQAIQEQLGLRLVPARGPVDVLVIDHIERPSAN